MTKSPGSRPRVRTGAVARVAMLMALAACTGDPPPLPVDVGQPMASPAAAGSALPHLARGTDGQVVLSWVEPIDDGHRLRYAVIQADSWSSPGDVAAGDDWFVNWADFPSVTPIRESLWAAHWLVKRPGNVYSYDVAIAVSVDGGATWSDPVTPHDDGTPTEHGFASLFYYQGAVGAVWLDGRNMAGAGDGHDGHGTSANGGMTLRAATIDRDGGVGNALLVDELVCDCCQTDAAEASDGIVVAYRDRTADEIRDIRVARLSTGSQVTGTSVADDGWQIDGCPVNGPAIAADDSTVVVAWFTAANDTPTVRLARSDDGGSSFAEPVDVDTHRPFGRVDVALLGDGSAAVSWLARGPGKGAELRVRRVTRDGQAGVGRAIATVSGDRASGFAQMVAHGAGLLFAWTDSDGDTSVVRTARIPGGSL